METEEIEAGEINPIYKPLLIGVLSYIELLENWKLLYPNGFFKEGDISTEIEDKFKSLIEKYWSKTQYATKLICKTHQVDLDSIISISEIKSYIDKTLEGRSSVEIFLLITKASDFLNDYIRHEIEETIDGNRFIPDDHYLEELYNNHDIFKSAINAVFNEKRDYPSWESYLNLLKSVSKRIKLRKRNNGVVQITANLNDIQLNKLYELLIDYGFIPSYTDKDSFIWAFGGENTPEEFIPIKWIKNKQLLRELLCGIIPFTNLKIADIERRCPDLFTDEKEIPIKLSKNKKVPSLDSDNLKSILKRIATL